MNNALGMLELGSIAAGLEACDFMVKAARVDLLRAVTLCPGKYMVIVAGDVGDVRASMDAGVKNAGEHVVDTLFIPNIHPQLIPAVSMTSQVARFGAIGALEFFSVASAITAGDVAAKAANITLIEIRTGYAVGGKGFVTLTGDVGAVRAAVEAAAKNAELLVATTVIPKPSPLLIQSLL